ncbi:MAG: AAA family ATPase [Halothiobacillaceae bacterium]|nr:MAG: AAA family ATPase [Halothiobacillaceae bacterium]
MSAALDNHRTLVQALLKQLRDRDPAARLIETHISSVILAGERAWKLKKPVDFGFLDFTDLNRRIHFCHEELRLNRALGGGLYLEVAEIRGTPEAPHFDGTGDLIEAAVVMRRFPDGAQLDEVLTREGLPLARMDELAERITAFHAAAPVVAMDSALGEPATVHVPMAQNFEQIEPLLDPADSARHEQLERLRLWTEAAYARLGDTLAARKRNGFVRELHGDMHLGNMARVDGNIVIFDAIEFNDSFRWIDAMSELAFLLMDLEDRQLPAHACRLLNRYLERTGDYAGLELLRFYQAYRAMVRAKVALLGVAFGGTPEQVAEARARYARYADLAETYTRTGSPRLLITHGFSGSGKSHAALILAESAGLIRIRSDIERQRLFPERGEDTLFTGRYAPQATEQTYARLLKLAEDLIKSGFGVILDATYLKADPRQAARALTERLHVPFNILSMHCPEALLRQRLLARAKAGGDPSEATLDVLHAQLQGAEPLGDEEKRVALPMRCDAPAEGQIAELMAIFHTT